MKHQSEHFITLWLNHLQVLMPPADVILVGAGNGQGAWVQWLLQQATAPQITLIEADTRQFATLQRTVAEHADVCERYRLLNEVVAPQDGIVPFFIASSTAESGLLPPDSLQTIWPNLQTVEVQQRKAIGLEKLLSPYLPVTNADSPQIEQRDGVTNSLWLLMDCLSAGDMLNDWANQLGFIDVLIARALLDNNVNESIYKVPHASADFVENILKTAGLVRTTTEVTRHPAIGYILFVRDMHTTLIEQDKVHRDQQLQAEQKALQLIQRCTAAEKLFSECQTQIEKLTQVNAAVEKQAQERAQQVEQLSKVRDEQVKLTQEHQTQIKQLTQAKAAAEKQAQEQTQQAAQLSKACNEQARLVQERQTQIEQLMQVKAAAERQAQERDPQIEQLSKACDEQARLTKEHRTQIEQLTRSVRSELNRYASGEMLTRLLKRRFFEHTGKLPTENLTTFNEKITWAMMFDVNPLKTRCADKYLVRDYVTQKIGKKYLPELYGVYDSAESIDFNSLPQEFIISATHGWNQMMVIKDKESLDISGTRRKLNEWLLHDHFAGVCEMQYRFIPPKLIARELLKINEIEYNIFCFHGKVEYIQTIAYDPCHNALGTKYFTPQWVEEEFYSNIGKINKDTPKPHCLLEMLEIAMSLSSEFDFVRVDLFMLDDGSIRFCELTFSPAAGYMKFSSISSAKFIDEKFGSLWRLPERDEEGFSKQGRCILDPSTLQHF